MFRTNVFSVNDFIDLAAVTFKYYLADFGSSGTSNSSNIASNSTSQSSSVFDSYKAYFNK